MSRAWGLSGYVLILPVVTKMDAEKVVKLCEHLLKISDDRIFQEREIQRLQEEWRGMQTELRDLRQAIALKKNDKTKR